MKIKFKNGSSIESIGDESDVSKSRGTNCQNVKANPILAV